MIAAPGAMISGFGTPVTVGPALENQHGSPPTGSRGIAVGSGWPPAWSSTGASRPMEEPSRLCHDGLLIVHPTAMIAGWVAGRLMVPSLTPSKKPTAPGSEASPVPCT